MGFAERWYTSLSKDEVIPVLLTERHAMKVYWRCSSTHFLTSALDGVSGQLHTPVT
jgi:hypothetical protein